MRTKVKPMLFRLIMDPAVADKSGARLTTLCEESGEVTFESVHDQWFTERMTAEMKVFGKVISMSDEEIIQEFSDPAFQDPANLIELATQEGDEKRDYARFARLWMWISSKLYWSVGAEIQHDFVNEEETRSLATILRPKLHHTMKSYGFRMDVPMCGIHLIMLILRFGALDDFLQGTKSLLGYWRDIMAEFDDKQTARDANGAELGGFITCILPVLELLGLHSEAREFLVLTELSTWSVTDAESTIDQCWKACEPIQPLYGESGKEAFTTPLRLLELLVDAEAAVPYTADAASLVPSAERLQFSDNNDWVYSVSWSQTLHLGARVHEKIGNDAAAEECAKNSLAFHRCLDAKVHAASTLGRCAKRRGDNDTAAQHFQQAAEFAHRGEMPLLAALAGLDCGGEAGEAIISKAFGEMGKQRASFARLGF